MDVQHAKSILNQIENSLKLQKSNFAVDFSHVDFHLIDNTSIDRFTVRIFVHNYEYGCSISAATALEIGSDLVASHLIGQGIGQYMWQHRNKL